VLLGFIQPELLRGAAWQQEHLTYKILRQQFGEESQGTPKAVAGSGAVLRHYASLKPKASKRWWRSPSVGDQRKLSAVHHCVN